MIEKILNTKIKKVRFSMSDVHEDDYFIDTSSRTIYIELDNGWILKIWSDERINVELTKRCKKCGDLMTYAPACLHSPEPFPDGEICWNCAHEEGKDDEEEV